jgi:hypothetical protein
MAAVPIPASKETLMSTKLLIAAGALAFTLTAGAIPSHADASHPPYFKILNELHSADQLLQGTTAPGSDVIMARSQVALAISECKMAGRIPDSSDLPSNIPMPAMHTMTVKTDGSTLQQVHQLLKGALTDLTASSDKTARGMQMQAMNHIVGAITYTHNAMVNANTSPQLH